MSATKLSSRRFDLPSLLFLLGVVANTLLVAHVDQPWLRWPLVLLQALLLVGCQEAKHQCVHRNFLRGRHANEMVGMVCAALVCTNFIAYRYFHLQHHRTVCTEADPEGRLYALSWRTRWIWLLAPLEVPWVAFHINRVGWRLVPPAQHAARGFSTGVVLAVAALLMLVAWHAPQTLLWAYALPMVLSAWISFVLTQAEHYGAPVVPAACRRHPAEVTVDVVLPWGLGWPMLHGSLHRVHHAAPGTHWFDAPARLKADRGAAPVTLACFVRRWLAHGPRLWGGAAANATGLEP